MYKVKDWEVAFMDNNEIDFVETNKKNIIKKLFNILFFCTCFTGFILGFLSIVFTSYKFHLLSKICIFIVSIIYFIEGWIFKKEKRWSFVILSFLQVFTTLVKNELYRF